MFTQAELVDAINELEGGKHSIQNCEKMAAIFTVLDHLYAPEQRIEIPYQQSYASGTTVETEVGLYGQSEFLKAIAGKRPREAWLLVDELVEAVSVFNPKLLSSFFEKLNRL